VSLDTFRVKSQAAALAERVQAAPNNDERQYDATVREIVAVADNLNERVKAVIDSGDKFLKPERFSPETIKTGLSHFERIKAIKARFIKEQDEIDYKKKEKELQKYTDGQIQHILLFSTSKDWERNPNFFLALANIAYQRGLYSRLCGGRLG